MGKDKSEKKEKKDKKVKVETNGVAKKVKKEKKDKKEKRKSDVTELLEQELESSADEKKPIVKKVEVDEDGDADMSDAEEKPAVILGAVVPFANPLADEKQTKKVMKGVKKGMINALPLLYANLPSHFLLRRNHPTDTPPPNSCQTQDSQARRQRSCQSPPQIPNFDPRLRQRPRRRRHHRRRYLANGRHLASTCALRGPQHPLHVRHVTRGAGRGGRDKAADERGDGCEGEGGE
jgi:hypothetical protein